MNGHTTKDKVRNNYIQEKVGVTPIEEKIIETRLQWFQHVQRKPLKATMRKVEQLVFSPRERDRRRPKRTLKEIIKGDF